MGTDIPTGFTDAFIEWFRERTEAAWETYSPRAFEEYVTAGVGGDDWQQGTRWLGGLTEEQIGKVEWRWRLRFPPDYRLFLRRLHAVDRPMRGARYTNPHTHPDEAGTESHLVPTERPSLHNWLTDSAEIQSALDWLVEGLEFDIEHADLWRPGWGARPQTLDGRTERLRGLIATAPRLIPVFSHRYLLAEPCMAGNPVFSIYQSDIIVHGADLRGFFLAEFADLLGLDRHEIARTTAQAIDERTPFYAAIPFWGDLWANAG